MKASVVWDDYQALQEHGRGAVGRILDGRDVEVREFATAGDAEAFVRAFQALCWAAWTSNQGSHVQPRLDDEYHEAMTDLERLRNISTEVQFTQY